MGNCCSNEFEANSKRDSGQTQDRSGRHSETVEGCDPGSPRFSTSDTRKSLRGSYVVEKDGTKTYTGFYSPRLGGIVGGEGTSSNGRAYKGQRHGSEASRSHSQSTTAQNYSFGTSYTTSSQAARGSAQLANASFGTQYSLEDDNRRNSQHQQQELHRKMKMLACGASSNSNKKGGAGAGGYRGGVSDCASNASVKSVLPVEPEGVEEAWSEAMRRSSFEGRGSAPQTAENIPLNPEFESINDSIAKFREAKRSSEKYLLASKHAVSGSGGGGGSYGGLSPVPSPSQPTRPPSPAQNNSNEQQHLPHQVVQDVSYQTLPTAPVDRISMEHDVKDCGGDSDHQENYMAVSVSPNEKQRIEEEAKKGWFMTPQSRQGALSSCGGSSPGANSSTEEEERRRSSSGPHYQGYNSSKNISGDRPSPPVDLGGLAMMPETGEKGGQEGGEQQLLAEKLTVQQQQQQQENHHRASVPDGISVPALNMNAVEVSNQERAREKARREQLLKQQKQQQKLQKQGGHILKTKHVS